MTTHHCHPDGTRTLVENCGLEPILFAKRQTPDEIAQDIDEYQERIKSICQLLGIDRPGFAFGPSVPCYAIEDAIAELQAEAQNAREDADALIDQVRALEAQQASGYRSAFNGGPGRLEQRWAELHPAQAAEHKRRAEVLA